MFEISLDQDDPRKLSQACVQITALLGLYQAELARILHLQCGDVGRLASGQWCLEPASEAWRQAQLFLRFYRRLYGHLDGEAVAMVHWLRVRQEGLTATPHQLMVDDDRLAELLAWFERDPVSADL